MSALAALTADGSLKLGGVVARSNETNGAQELMTLPELAAYLTMSERTIYDWAQQGKVPAYQLGSSWRFRRSAPCACH